MFITDPNYLLHFGLILMKINWFTNIILGKKRWFSHVCC